MKIGASTLYGVNKEAGESVRELLDNGINVIELMYEGRHKIDGEQAEGLAGLGADYSLHLPFCGIMLANPDPKMRFDQKIMIGYALNAAEELGAAQCVLHGGEIPEFYMQIEKPMKKEEFYRIFANEMGDLVSKASISGIKVVLENLPSSQLGSNYVDIIEIKKLMPQLGFCLDAPHALMNDDLELYSMGFMEIDHVHVSDSYQGKDAHLAIGKGHLPIKDIMNDLKKKGYKGKVIFEGLSLEDTLESVKKLREMIK